MGLEDPVKFSRRPSYRRVGLYLFWLVVSGICTAVLVFSITMQALGWRLAPLEEGPRGSFSGRRQALAIYGVRLSDATMTFAVDEQGRPFAYGWQGPWSPLFRRNEIEMGRVTR